MVCVLQLNVFISWWHCCPLIFTSSLMAPFHGHFPCGPSESLEQTSVESQSSYPRGSTWYFEHSKVARHGGNRSLHKHLAARNIISVADWDVKTTNVTFLLSQHRQSQNAESLWARSFIMCVWMGLATSPSSTWFFFILSLFPQGWREGWMEGWRTGGFTVQKTLYLRNGQSAHFAW